MQIQRYKAWHVNTHSTLPPGQFALRADGFWIQLLDEKQDKWGLCQDGMIFLPYSGLFDKNQREICDADICRGKYETEPIVINAVPGGFDCVVWRMGKPSSSTPLTEQLASSLEVVGNTFEDPELLEA